MTAEAGVFSGAAASCASACACIQAVGDAGGYPAFFNNVLRPLPGPAHKAPAAKTPPHQSRPGLSRRGKDRG